MTTLTTADLTVIRTYTCGASLGVVYELGGRRCATLVRRCNYRTPAQQVALALGLPAPAQPVLDVYEVADLLEEAGANIWAKGDHVRAYAPRGGWVDCRELAADLAANRMIDRREVVGGRIAGSDSTTFGHALRGAGIRACAW